MTEGNVSSTSLDQLLDEQPPLIELINNAKTAEWFSLGIQLELDKVKLNGCKSDLSRVYDLWIQEKAENATRRNLLLALKAIGQNDVARRYKEYLETLVCNDTETRIADHTDSHIPSTKEYQVLQKYFCKLTYAITDPVRLAADLFKAELMSDSTRIKVNNGTSSKETRNYHILNELMIAVTIDPTNLMKIISVLQGYRPFLSAIAKKIMTEYEISTTQSTDEQPATGPSTTVSQLTDENVLSISMESSVISITHSTCHRDIITLPHALGENEYSELLTMQGKLASLVLTIQKIVESAHININDLKQLLILSNYSSELEEIRGAKDFASVFVVVHKLCSPVNIEVLILIGNHFKLSDTIEAIHTYELEEQSYRKKLLSSAFAQDLMREAKIMDRYPTPDCTISLKLKSSRANYLTVKEFEIVVNNVFLDCSPYIHVCKVGEGCIFVTMCAPKPLMEVIVKMAKTRLSYLHDIGVILLQIGDEIILDKREKEEIHNPELAITATVQKSSSKTDDVYEYQSKDIQEGGNTNKIGKNDKFVGPPKINVLGFQEEQKIRRSEMVVSSPIAGTHPGYFSDPVSFQTDFNISAKWLIDAIKNPLITVNAAPFLMCITGLPSSNLSIITHSLLKQLQCGMFKQSAGQRVCFYETSAVRIPGDPSKELKYSESFYYSTVIESAIKHHLYLKGQFIRNIELPDSDTTIFNDDELDHRFKNTIKEFYLKSKKDTEKFNPIWTQGLPSGISLINLWEIGLSKAAAYILPLLSGHLYNSYVWMLFDINNDLSSLYEPPNVKEKRKMEFHSRLHYLLRSVKLAAKKNSKRTNVCKLISYVNSSKTLTKQEKKFEDFQSNVNFAATQMEVVELVDIDDILLLHSGMKKLSQLKKAFDNIVHRGLDQSIDIPLSYIFLRSLYYEKPFLFITKKAFKEKAAKLGMDDNDFNEFCQLFTSFGSIIDVSLIDKKSDTIILKPVDFLQVLDRLFHLLDDVDPLVTKYGIVTVPTAENIFNDLTSIMMDTLVSFGIATKIQKKQINGTFSTPNGFVYYVPNASNVSSDLECQPSALHLLRDLNRPMSHSKVAFTSKFLELCPSTMLELPDDSKSNFITFKTITSNNAEVVFAFVYLGDAIEFRFPPSCKHEEVEDVCRNIITVCHDIIPKETKYNFAVMCSADLDPTLAYKLKREHHLLPNSKLCQTCQSKGLHNDVLLQVWNKILEEENNEIPKERRLNGNPLTIEDACSVAKGLAKLSEETLQVVAKCLDMPNFYTEAERKEWRKCMTMILDWENLCLLSKNEEEKKEASKKMLATKIMNAANELHEKNAEDSKALENVARSLNFEVASSMSKKTVEENGQGKGSPVTLPISKESIEVRKSSVIADLFDGMVTVGKKICYYYTNTDNTIKVEECGLKVHIPSEAISPVDSKFEVAAQGLWSRNFEFPEGTKLISGVCSVSISVELKKTVTVGLIHCANIINKEQTKYLSFVVANSGPPFKFELLSGGSFSSDSQYGSICLKQLSLIAIVQITSGPVTADRAVVGGAVVGGAATFGGATFGVGGVIAGALIGAVAGIVTVGVMTLRRHLTSSGVTIPKCYYRACIFYKRINPGIWELYFVVIQDNPYTIALLKKREFEFGVKDDDFRFCFSGDTLNLSEFPSGDNLQDWMVMSKHKAEINKKHVDDFTDASNANPPYISVLIYNATGRDSTTSIIGHRITINGTNKQSFFTLKLLKHSYILKQTPGQREVLQLLADINDKWCDIGEALGIHAHVLNSLKTSLLDNNMKLGSVIHSWVTTAESYLITWETLIAAIEGPLIDNRHKAMEIRKYLAEHC